jgi:hypothetical protein
MYRNAEYSNMPEYGKNFLYFLAVYTYISSLVFASIEALYIIGSVFGL